MSPAPDPASGFRREASLVPADSVPGRALIVVIAIMTFLACLAAGGAWLIGRASDGWRDGVSHEATIQVKARRGEDLDALVAKVADAAAKADGVLDVRILSKSESERLLEPWLGSGLDLTGMPIPRLVIANLQDGEGRNLDPLRQALASVAPSATLDDHRLWMRRLTAMADVVAAFAVCLFVLVVVAMATAIGFATRGAMSGNREIIEVLHFVGASDDFISRHFQYHFFRLGLRGAFIGGVAAALFFGLAGGVSLEWRRSPGAEEISALFGAFSLGWLGYISLAVICAFIALLTAYLSRRIAFSHVRTLY